jgi:hypothetical protein
MASQRAASLVLVVLLLAGAGTGLPAQTPTLDELLARAEATLRRSTPALVNIVAQEEYLQQARVFSPGRVMTGSRRLKSDVLFVRQPGAGGDWILFRDVFEVDGSALPHDPERLVRLFVTPPADAAERIAAIAAESQKHHFEGSIAAGTNPFVGVALLQPDYRPRLRFSGGGVDREAGRGVRAVRFRELDGNADAPEPLFVEGRAEGTIWIDEATGRVVKTEVWPHGRDTTKPMTATTFTLDSRLGVMVPVEMRTTWYASGSAPRSRAEVTGTATYGTFRRFEVDASTTIVLPPNP